MLRVTYFGLQYSYKELWVLQLQYGARAEKQYFKLQFYDNGEMFNVSELLLE